jgi:hypothetical protein
MSQSDKSNRVERVWNDPPMIEDPPEDYTLGSNVSPEIQKVITALELNVRKARLISTMRTAVYLTGLYAMSMLFPNTSQITILNGLIAAAIMLILIEIGRYYKVV